MIFSDFNLLKLTVATTKKLGGKKQTTSRFKRNLFSKRPGPSFRRSDTLYGLCSSCTVFQQASRYRGENVPARTQQATSPISINAKRTRLKVAQHTTLMQETRGSTCAMRPGSCTKRARPFAFAEEASFPRVAGRCSTDPLASVQCAQRQRRSAGRVAHEEALDAPATSPDGARPE